MKWIIAFTISLSLVAAALYPPPCEMQGQSGNVARAAQQPAPADIVTGPVDAPTAKRNRELVESTNGARQLPAGEIVFDRMPALRSGVTLAGPATLRQQHEGGNFPLNCVLGAPNTSIGHVHPFTHGRADHVTVSADVAAKCSPGTVVFTWKNQGYVTGNNFNQRRTVIARSGNTLRLDAAIAPQTNVLKWLATAAPIADAPEGANTVTVSRDAQVFSVGAWVLVTSGPSIADEATGDLRRVTAVAGNTVTLDRPLRRAYKDAALAKVTPTSDVTLRDLTIELPVNRFAESLYASLAVNWTIERCTIRRTALGNCAGITFSDCTLGWVQAAAASHDLAFRGGSIQSITFEEGCQDNVIERVILGPVQANQNCVSLRAWSDRLLIRNCVFLGGAWPCAQILCDTPSRESRFENLMMFGPAPCWLKAGCTLGANVVSGGDINWQ